MSENRIVCNLEALFGDGNNGLLSFLIQLLLLIHPHAVQSNEIFNTYCIPRNVYLILDLHIFFYFLSFVILVWIELIYKRIKGETGGVRTFEIKTLKTTC